MFDFIGQEHWRNHRRWDPNVIEITLLTGGPVGLGSHARGRRRRGGDDDEILDVTAFEPSSRRIQEMVEAETSDQPPITG